MIDAKRFNRQYPARSELSQLQGTGILNRGGRDSASPDIPVGMQLPNCGLCKLLTSVEETALVSRGLGSC